MNGLILIDKQQGYTSRDICNIIAKKYQTKKVGHLGTLDPLATGLLVVAINDGLKIVSLLNEEKKEYLADVKFGTLTDTLDITGTILKRDDKVPTKEDLIKILNSFLGESIQEVPLYSAVKVDGKKLYQYARNNEEVVLPKKNITIFEIELLTYNLEGFSFRVLSSKGTYIRSLIRDIGVKLDVFCNMSGLRRIRQGDFYLKDANLIDEIKSIISIPEALINYDFKIASDELKFKIINGAIIDNIYDSEEILFKDEEGNVLAIYGMYQKDNSKLKPIKVIYNDNK